MNAEIIDGDDRGLGVKVIDDHGIEHKISVGFDGEIQGHTQEGISGSPESWTADDWTILDQAERYARYHVFQESDHQTVPPYETQDSLERALTAIEALSEDAFAAEFDHVYEQVKDLSAGVDPTVPLPADARPHPKHRRDDPAQVPFQTDDASEMAGRGDVRVMVDIYLDDDDAFEERSGIHHRYYNLEGEWATDWGQDPFPDRTPAARLQLWCYPTMSRAGFRNLVENNIKCQIRDIYIGRGLEPPETYRITGPGLQELSVPYADPDVTVYPPYHNFHAVIDGYRREFEHL